MNIGGLIRSLIGDLQQADPKMLELKVGQVVKGVVMQVLSDQQEAIVNISGMQVRAKLETPLKQGDVTMLQVQPESSGSQIFLKPLTASDVQIADDSMGELLKSFTLKDSTANRQLVQHIQQEGVPLTKETVQSFASVVGSVPDGADKEKWTQAAVIAFKRGLPLTQETVSALKQATSGPPLGDVLERLEQEASVLLKEQPAAKAADTLTQLVSLLKELRTASAAVWTARPPQPAADAANLPAPMQAGDTPEAPPAGPPKEGSAAVPTAAAKPAAAAQSGAAAGTASASQYAEEALGADPAKPSAPQSAPRLRGAAEAPAQARSAEPGRTGEPPLAGSPEPGPQRVRAAAESAVQAAGSAAPDREADPGTNWISRMLKAVGVDHEQQLARLAERPDAAPRQRQSEPDPLGLVMPSDTRDGSDKPVADSLKSLLLQLTSSEELPATLKEAAQQTLQHITGQQLLLSNQADSMFSHLTLFIPFMDGSGQQSASVHIQSRKGKRGEVDATNCRLLFDLQMKAMGSTLVDVQVVNKIVSLSVHNDHPAAAALIEGAKEEISESLRKVGYQFLSVKVSPFPLLTGANETDGAKNGYPERMRLDAGAFYQPKPYKGVDYRA